MRLKRLIKEWTFEASKRSKVTLGTDVRLVPELSCLRLKADSDGEYPTDSDLYAKTWLTEPANARAWQLFSVDVVHATVDGQIVTETAYRLSDGVDEYWWDGGAWVVNTTDWNTEAEVCDHIGDFPVPKIQVVINLKTNNKLVSPRVNKIKVLYASTIEFKEDLIYRSLVPALRDGVRPIGEYPVDLETATSTIDLANDYPLETPYKVVGIDSAFNHTDDPGHVTDILQSFNVGDQEVTLTGSVDAGKTVWLRFIYEPVVAVSTSVDYSEISAIPSIVLDDLNLINAAAGGADDYILAKHTNEAVRVPRPLQGDLEVLAHIITDKGVDLQRLADALESFLLDNPLLKSVGLDEEYRLWMLDEMDQRTVANMGDLHSARLRFRVAGALFYQRESTDEHGVQGTLKTTADSNLKL